MLGAITGDIVGSVYENNENKTKDFPLFKPNCEFTDDTVLTIAVADAIMSDRNYADKLKSYYRRYPDADYGTRFAKWGASDSYKPYNSWGNGSAMRVSPIGFAFKDLDTVLKEAKRTAQVTHNHPEGIKGAQAVAAAIFLAKTDHSKVEIKVYVEKNFGYNLSQPLEETRSGYEFDVSCQGSVPPAIIAFLESTDFEDGIRNAISLGGDSDTIGCMTGGISEAFYGGVPKAITKQVFNYLDDGLLTIIKHFYSTLHDSNLSKASNKNIEKSFKSNKSYDSKNGSGLGKDSSENYAITTVDKALDKAKDWFSKSVVEEVLKEENS
jgi:ADP-ribosylglycohydrolase